MPGAVLFHIPGAPSEICTGHLGFVYIIWRAEANKAARRREITAVLIK